MTSPRGVTTSTSVGSGSTGPRTITPGLRSLTFISSNSNPFGPKQLFGVHSAGRAPAELPPPQTPPTEAWPGEGVPGDSIGGWGRVARVGRTFRHVFRQSNAEGVVLLDAAMKLDGSHRRSGMVPRDGIEPPT